MSHRSSPRAADRPFVSRHPVRHDPTRREVLAAEIADALADLAGVYCGDGDDLHPLTDRLARLDERGLERLRSQLRAAVNAIG